MEISILAAKILSIIYLSVAVAAFRNAFDYEKIVKNFEDSPALTIITAYMAIFVGMLLITYHNIWVKDWPVLITFMGWAITIKGVAFLAYPELLGAFKGKFKNTQKWGPLLLALGLLFGYFGFVV